MKKIISWLTSCLKSQKNSAPTNQQQQNKEKSNMNYLIKKYEGFSGKPYLCPAGVATIGYGSTHYSDGTPVTMKDKPITKETAEALLLHYVVNEIQPHIRDLVLTDNQKEALYSLIYNIGWPAFAKSKCYKAIKAGDMCTAYTEWTWVKGGGKVLLGLVKRRAEEKYLFFCEI